MSTIMNNNRMGGGAGGEVGNMMGSVCLKTTMTRTNTTTTMTNMTMRRMGRCHAGEQTTGRIQLQRLQCCPWAIHWDRGVEDVNCWPPRHCRHRQQQQPPLGGWGIMPPPSGLSHPTRCRSSLSMSLATVNGGGTRAFGAWSYMWWRRQRSTPLY